MLDESVRACGEGALNLGHGACQWLGCSGIAEPPTGHGKSLGEAVDGDGTFLHARQGSERSERLAISDVFVNLVRDYQQLRVSGDDLGDLFQFLAAVDGA